MRLKWTWLQIRKNWAPRIAFGLVGLQLVTALAMPHSGEHEIYPFFQWNLFPTLSRISTDFELSILQINAVVLEKPMLMSHATRYFPLTGYYEGYVVLQKYGSELVSEKPNDIEMKRYKDLIERDYLGNGTYNGEPVHHVVYQIERVVFDPYKRAQKIQKSVSKESLGEFSIEW